MIRLETCNNGDIWIHLDVPKLTPSVYRKVREQAKILAREHGYPMVFCLVPDTKFKLASCWGFKFSRKVNYRGAPYNIMTLETYKC